jgi:cation diffusion facilitator CzcD-associated flavoprotein CzcO
MAIASRKVTVKNLTTGETFDDTSNVLLMARGQLNNESWPDIPDLDKFGGKVMHSASWDERSVSVPFPHLQLHGIVWIDN